MDFVELLKRWVHPLRMRISNITGKGVVTQSSDEAGLQTLQIKMAKDETRDNVPRLQNYGFTSHPEEGAQIVAIFPDGNREGGVIIALDHFKYRIQVNKLEVAMYSKFGNKIVLKDDGSIEATPATGKPFKVNGDFEASGNVKATGDISTKSGNIETTTGNVSTSTGDIKAATTSLRLHVHTSAAPGNPTTPPI